MMEDPKLKIIVRSSQEGSLEHCLNALKRTENKLNLCFEIEILQKAPFEEALFEGFNIGVKTATCNWVGFLDADVIVESSEILRLCKFLVTTKAHLLQGFVFDKYFGQLRSGGLHVYHHSVLPNALNSIPSIGISIRPETATKFRLVEQGFRLMQLPFVIGLHDYYQTDADIYRKGVVYSEKKIQESTELLIFWKQRINANTSNGYRVMLEGYLAGLKMCRGQNVHINRSEFELDLMQKNNERAPETCYERDAKILKDQLRGLAVCLIRYSPISSALKSKFLSILFEIYFMKRLNYFKTKRFRSVRIILFIISRKRRIEVLY